MIVLDENLKDPQVAASLRAWYRGRICHINDLRPGTTIKDDAIPMLLRAQPGCVFITENEIDFWKRVPSDPSFCLIALGCDFEPEEVSAAVRAVFRLKEFRTRQERSGKIARATRNKVEYYMPGSSAVVSLDLRIG